MFVDCIHVVLCRPLGLITDLSIIFNACLAEVPSGNIKMCSVNIVFFIKFISP